MQVARLLEDGSTGAWAGKLRQVRLALALERVLSKDEILALYLHHAPMGGNLEGVRAGSLAWFGKEPERLTEAEAALLVALPQAPALRSPDRTPRRRARRATGCWRAPRRWA
jgi:penicillin-binding protein 1C